MAVKLLFGCRTFGVLSLPRPDRTNWSCQNVAMESTPLFVPSGTLAAGRNTLSGRLVPKSRELE